MNKDDVIIDCGANVGDLELYFSIFAPDVVYFGVEPSPSEYKCLEKNILLSSSEYYNIAFYDKTSILKFYLSSEFGDSSLIEPSSYTDSVTVKTMQLDEFVDQNNIASIKLLKLEAEGAEPEILMGARQCLSRIQYIAADLGFERGIRQSSTLPDVANFLIMNNFEIVDITKGRLVCLFKNKFYAE